MRVDISSGTDAGLAPTTSARTRDNLEAAVRTENEGLPPGMGSDEVEKGDDPFRVDFDGPDDARKAQNWT